MIYIRSFVFFVGQVMSVLVFSLLLPILLAFPTKLKVKILSLWAHFIIWWLKVTCNLTLTVTGKENIPSSPCVFASNHQSAWETFALQTFLPTLAWVLKKELLNIPFFGWGLRAIQPIAIDRKERKSAMEQVIQQGAECLKNGRYVLIFPEGTRVSYGQSKRYKLGFVKLARSANTPIVPISHDGGKYWGEKGGWLRKPGVVQCYIGKPIKTDNKTDQEVADEIKQWIESQHEGGELT